MHLVNKCVPNSFIKWYHWLRQEARGPATLQKSFIPAIYTTHLDSLIITKAIHLCIQGNLSKSVSISSYAFLI